MIFFVALSSYHKVQFHFGKITGKYTVLSPQKKQEVLVMVNMANESLYGDSIEKRTRDKKIYAKYGIRWEEYRALWDSPLKDGGEYFISVSI